MYYLKIYNLYLLQVYKTQAYLATNTTLNLVAVRMLPDEYLSRLVGVYKIIKMANGSLHVLKA